jgi:hypothetical protein
VVSAADRHLRALSDELRGDTRRVAARVGFEFEGVEEAAWERSERMFYTVTDPHQLPGPQSASAIAGAWLHGALCGACAHHQTGGATPTRIATIADWLEATCSYGARCDEMGDSKAALAHFGMLRDRDQPAFAALAPDRAVTGLGRETGMSEPVARDLLGVMAVDGMAIARDLLERLARDPSRPSSRIHADVVTSRLYRDALELMTMPPPRL